MPLTDRPTPRTTPGPAPRARSAWQRLAAGVRCWFDAGAAVAVGSPAGDHRPDWLRIVPFLALHVACLGVLWVGVSPVAVLVALGLYLVRMFAVTAFYHRYFSHRSFRTNRFWQLVFAILGGSAVQKGPLWWAAHHRQHHRVSDRPGDAHSPVLDGFLWSHVGWIASRRHVRTQLELVPDLARYPELRFLDRFNVLVPIALLVLLGVLGAVLEARAPALGTSPAQMIVWGFCISTVVLFHATSTINSLAHLFGRRRFPTRDHSRNNLPLALLTLGEGWHNNHHYYPMAVRQGFYWWEVDVTYYVLRVLSWLGVVRDLKPVPPRVLAQGRGATAPPPGPS